MASFKKRKHIFRSFVAFYREKQASHRFLGSTDLNLVCKDSRFFMSISLCIGFLLCGYLASCSLGRVGLFSKPPPQLGHTFWSIVLTQSTQKVHSKVQIMAESLSLGNGLLQCSQERRISSIVLKYDFCLSGLNTGGG